MEDGMCRLAATLPQLDEQKCPDMFRCTEEVSYWLHENEERKQQIASLKETISELQEELRNHRHRIKVLELQVRSPYGLNRPGSTISSNPVNYFEGFALVKIGLTGCCDKVTAFLSQWQNLVFFLTDHFFCLLLITIS